MAAIPETGLPPFGFKDEEMLTGPHINLRAVGAVAQRRKSHSPPFQGGVARKRRGGYKRCEATLQMVRSLHISMRCASRSSTRSLRII